MCIRDRYKPFTHQHLGEIGETLGSPKIYFLPHRGNFTRGIFASCYTPIDGKLEQMVELYKEYYKSHPFTHVSDKELTLKQVVNTNQCAVHLHQFEDQLLVTSVIDNLITGNKTLIPTKAKHFNFDEHQIITQEDNDHNSFIDEYDLPKNLSIIKLPKFGPKMYPISLSMRKKIKSFNADVLYLKGLWRHTSLEAYFWKKTNPNKILIVCPAGMLQPIPLKNKRLSLIHI